MVHDEQLPAVLRDLTVALRGDFPIQGILDTLVERVVDVLPVAGAAATLISPGLAAQYIAASSEPTMRWEQLQTQLGEGPGLLAYESGNPVVAPDLANDDRFPLFAPTAVAAGLAGVFTLPLHHATGRLGALDLFPRPGVLPDTRELAVAETLADVASAYLLSAQSLEEARDDSHQARGTALYDALTGLPNRVLLHQRIEHAAQRAERSQTFAGVLIVDLDEFTAINDSHGQLAGDQLLRAVADRLLSIVRPGDTLARMRGDEFVLLCEDLPGPREVEALAARLVEAFSSPFVLRATSGNHLTVTATVAIAYAGAGEDVSYELVVDADVALYQARRHGSVGSQVVDLRAARQMGDRHIFRRDLQKASTLDRLDVAYQPIVSAAEGCMTGVEALLRWTDPNRGPIDPRALVNLAERDGLIQQIGEWVLRRACEDHGHWAREVAHPVAVSVNVSALQLMAPGFSATVARVLDETSMDPAALILELTEGIFLEDTARALTVLDDLRAFGIRMALDDFGTGYSGLSHLRRFPVDIVKIDQAFIADIRPGSAGTAIVKAVTELAHELDLSVTAEGVETTAQHEEVVRLGCEHAQGFLYAAPMPRRELSALLAAGNGAPPSLRAPSRQPSASGARRSAVPVPARRA